MTPDDPRPPQPDPEDSGAPDVPAPSPSPSASPDAAASDAGTPDRPTAGSPIPDVPADDVDQLASALLDGDPGIDAAARERPEVVARAAELGTARATVRDVPAADPGARERALAAALAAFDEQAPPASAAPVRPPPPVDGPVPAPIPQPVDLAAHRRSPAGRVHDGRQGLPRWLGAAAAIVVVLAGLVGVAAVSSSGGDDADTAMDVGADEMQGSGDDGAGGSAEDSAEAPSAAGPDEGDAQRSAVEAGDLGMFPTGDALVDHLRATMGDGGDVDLEPEAGAPSGTEGEVLGAFAACDGAPPPPLDDRGATLVLHGRAVIGDEAADVWVIETDRGRRIVAINDACELVLDRPSR